MKTILEDILNPDIIDNEENNKENTPPTNYIFYDIIPIDNGRPLKKINNNGCYIVEQLAQLGCTIEEIAPIIGLTPPTIRNEINHDLFFSSYEKGLSKAKIRIRKAQLHTALVNHNPVMLVWLGKQLLGQTDAPILENNEKIEIKNSVPMLEDAK